ncbi:hypothetical protein ACLKA6_007188 [Drosophila palustris]
MPPPRRLFVAAAAAAASAMALPSLIRTVDADVDAWPMARIGSRLSKISWPSASTRCCECSAPIAVYRFYCTSSSSTFVNLDNNARILSSSSTCPLLLQNSHSVFLISFLVE